MGSQQNNRPLSIPRTLILIGPQGSGKGTQARFLIDKYHFQYLATGDLFREIALEDSELGKQIDGYLKSGQLVPDDLMMKIFKNKLQTLDIKANILFDGMPRTLNQAHLLDNLLNEMKIDLPHVIYLKISRQSAVERSLQRRICDRCNAPYLPHEQSYLKGICEKCGGKVIPRTDDVPQTIAKRLDQYYSETKSVIEYYRQNNRLMEIDGEPAIENVTAQIIDQLEQS